MSEPTFLTQPTVLETVFPEATAVPTVVTLPRESTAEYTAAPEPGSMEGTAGYTAVTEPDPSPTGLLPLWLSLAFLAGAAVCLGIRALLHALRKKPPKPEFALGKVHEIGARKEQQDSFSVSDPSVRDTLGLLAVVSDGMGGLSGGDKVSQCAVGAVMERFYQIQGSPEQVLLLLAERANQAVCRMLGKDGCRKSGATMVMGLLKADRFYYLSIGDSRISLLREGKLYTLNREHVYRQELALKAINGKGTWEEAVTHPRAAGLTSYLGMGELKYLDIPTQGLPVLPGDKLVLMSDGVYNALSDEELADILSAPAPQAAKALKKKIGEKNHPHQDNYTAVLIDCGKEKTS